MIRIAIHPNDFKLLLRKDIDKYLSEVTTSFQFNEIDEKKEVLYLTRSNTPYHFVSKTNKIYKHLSVISFKPPALKNFANHSNQLTKHKG